MPIRRSFDNLTTKHKRIYITMDWWLLTFFLGAILSLFLQEVPALFQLFLLLCLAIGFYSHKKLRYSSGLWFGALWILAQAYLYHNLLPPPLIELMENKQAFFIEGEVLSIQVKPPIMLSEHIKESAVQQKANSTKRFNFLVNKINQQLLESPITIRLSWQKSTIDLAQGQRLSLNVKVKPAHGLANIGTFNYLSWLKAHNIVATGYVVNPRKKKNSNYQEAEDLKSLKANKLLMANITMRQALFEHYQSLTPNHKLTPILLALAFGERSSLNTELWQTLQVTGTSHLIAISGLHIGLLAGSAFFIVMFFFQYIPLRNPCWQHINSRYIAIAVSLLLATAYAYLAGFSLPTQRALVMLNLYWLSRVVGIKFSAKRLILVTIFILLIITPFSLLTASFWLSVYAVAIIFVSLWRFKAWMNKGPYLWRFFKTLFIIQVALTVMLMPITALFFQKISLVSLFANIIAVPWMSAFSIPTALMSVVLIPISESLAQWFMMLSLQSLTWLWFYLDLLSELPNAIISLSFVQQMIVLLVGNAAFSILYLSPCLWTRGGKQITFVLLALSAIVFSYHEPIMSSLNTYAWSKEVKTPKDAINFQAESGFSSWEVIFFDVGQGTSVLIKRDDQAILYDTGAAYPSGFTMSDAVILPFLQYSAIEKLDKVILSHSDNDHVGGLRTLIEHISIDEIISNDKTLFNSKALSLNALSTTTNLGPSNRRLTDCQPRNSFSWQGLRFDILWPLAWDPSNESVNRGKQKNDDSCVILISDQLGTTLLLTGDISSKVEQKLLKFYPQLNADILQVPHHGSKTSSSQAFLSQLSPDVALVSAGYLNRWHMPVAIVRQRYHDSKIQLLNSAELGQIIITVDEEGMSTQSFTEDLRPFWFSH